MIVLLPPSEGKAVPQSGPPLDLQNRRAPLRQPTQQVLDALRRVCRDDPAQALKVLGINESQVHWLTVNAELGDSPTAAAHDIYTGVLYQALGYPQLSPRARQRADTMLWVASALYGVVQLGESIASYRMSGGTKLPGLTNLPKLWQSPISSVIWDTDPTLIVDMRSGAYANLWRPPEGLADRYVGVKVWQLDAKGHRTAVSHHNKATKGLLARELARLTRTPTTRRGLTSAAQRAGEVHGWNAQCNGAQLDIVLR